jgi:protease I
VPKRLLIITDDSGESLEIYYAQQRFLEAGWRPVIAATQRKLLHGVIHDFEPGWNTYVERPGYRIPSEVTFKQAKAADYEAVLCIGGRAPEFLRHEAAVLRLLRDFDRQGKWIFSICHGIQLLIAAGLVQGRTLTCYRNVRLELEQAGGKWVDRHCARDGRLITSQTWESHPDFYREIFRSLAEAPARGSRRPTRRA